MLTTLFLFLGISLFVSTESNMKEIDASFRTVGTIGQKIKGFIDRKQYNAIEEAYAYSTEEVFGEPIPVESFIFPDVEFIYPPTNRPFYIAESSEYVKGGWVSHDLNSISVLEYKILEIYPDALPVRAEVTKVLGGPFHEGQEIWVSQHYIENPVTLEEGKKYVSGLLPDGPLNSINAEDYWGIAKYTILAPNIPYLPLYSNQIDEDGKWLDADYAKEMKAIQLQDAMGGFYSNTTHHEQGINPVLEVTHDFYQSEAGRRLQLYAQGAEFSNSARITPVDSLDLLLEFYKRDIYYTDGREITQEEFDTGSAVCMIDADHASFNNLSVGDMVSFEFISAIYGESQGSQFAQYSLRTDLSANSFNAKGELYKSFFEDTYEIVGIYERMNKTYYDLSDPYALGYGAVILPAKSIKGSDSKNMNGNLILQPYNVSFEIPNGTSSLFMEKLEESGLADLVDVTFYDGGYENIKSGLMGIRSLAIILMLAGIATSLATLFFFTYIFIAKEKKRVAIERSLGITKRCVAISLVLGIMIVVLIGSTTGFILGFESSDYVAGSVMESSQNDSFSTEFSNWVLSLDGAKEENAIVKAADSILTPALAITGFLIISAIVATILVYVTINKSPIELLSGRAKQ